MSFGWHSVAGVTELDEPETLSYVECRPLDNPDSLRAKQRALALGDAKKRQRLLALAPGDAAADPSPAPGKKKVKKRKQALKAATKGPGWFGMSAPAEVGEEVKRDLEVLKMRSVLDPKRFYKKNDSNELPKYFQVKNKPRWRHSYPVPLSRLAR